MNKLLKQSFLNALGAGTYIAVVATLLPNGEKIFGPVNSTIAPILFLLLFVTSAAITGSLVFGRPVLMYLDGQKKEAVRMFLYTVCWLIAGMIVLLAVALGLR